MALKKCENCGKFFGAENDETLCHDCSSTNTRKVITTGDVEHDKFTNARAIVYDHPHITPSELADELTNMGLKTTIKEIMRFVTEGRLTLVTIDGGTYCSSCGRKIMLGTLCSDCSDKLDKFRKPATPAKTQTEDKKYVGMHTKKK
jgi:ribosomal protein L32